MKDIHQLWDSISYTTENNGSQGKIREKSSAEISRFKNLLISEIIISWFSSICILYFFNYKQLEVISIVLICLITGSILNINTIRKINKLDYNADVKHFLTQSKQIIQSLITGFIFLSQVVIILAFYILLKNRPEPFNAYGLEISIFIFIELILIGYAYFVYYSKYTSIKKSLLSLQP